MLFRHKPIRLIAFMLMDAFFASGAWVLTALMHTYFFRNYAIVMTLVKQNIWFIIVSCIAFSILTGVYRSLWLYPSAGSFIRIISSSFLSSFSVYVSFRVNTGYWQVPSIGVMAFYFLCTFSIGVRIFPLAQSTFKRYFARFRSASEQAPPVRTLIIGAGSSAVSLSSELAAKGKYKVAGFVDSDPRKHGYRIHGAPVLGSDESIPSIIERLNIALVVIAVPSMSNERIKSLVQTCHENQCKIKIMKSISEFAGSPGSSVRDLEPQDLLNREETVLDTSGIRAMLEGKTVLITGGGGSIGSEICRQAMAFKPARIVIFELSENNAHNLKQELSLSFKNAADIQLRIGSVQDPARLAQVFDEFSPQIVFHCAAFKHVPLMEDCPRIALENNVLGTYNTAIAAQNHGVKKFVFISTDKAVNPANIMGATKRLCEKVVLSLNCTGKTEFVCVRFGNVLGSNGSVIPIFKGQIEAGGPVTITDERMTRYFMTIPEASRLVIQAAAMAKGGETFILDMGQPVLIKDLAYNMIRLAGFVPEVDIKIEYTGLRPGEKLYEELTLDEEGVTKTSNNKIFVAKQYDRDASEAEEIITAVRKSVKRHESGRECICELLPEYTG